jgi:predicted  nucleic acid-binding Zn-ribbon protein
MVGKIRFLAAAIGLLALLTAGILAQSPAGGSDTLSRLLAEVRELRLVLQRQAADSARIQLLISRLTIQETRVSRLARDLDDVRNQLAQTEEEQRHGAEQLKRMEASLSQVTDLSQKEDFERQVGMMRQQIAVLRAREQRLRGREGELDGAFASEQGRWIEISNRLDDLERALVRP